LYSRVILDWWNEGLERSYIVSCLREIGINKIYCWRFITPVEVCCSWFTRKRKFEIKGENEYAVRHAHTSYHKDARHIEGDGFDAIIDIDPRQLWLQECFGSLSSTILSRGHCQSV
jgi:hypothetical protein